MMCLTEKSAEQLKMQNRISIIYAEMFYLGSTLHKLYQTFLLITGNDLKLT